MNWTAFAIAIVIILALDIIYRLRRDGYLRKNDNNSKTIYHYRAKRYIMSEREGQFYERLTTIFDNKCYVVPQVSLQNLLRYDIKGQSFRGAWQHINRKSVDYVLLKKSDLSVICAIELDDATHSSPSRQMRDDEVDRIFTETSIPFVRFLKINNLSDQEIVQQIGSALKA